MHPSIAGVLQYFRFEHLPEQPVNLRAVSRPFAVDAITIARRNPSSPETTVALRKLLEAKDAAVRASLPSMSVDEVVAWAAGVVEPDVA